ncbi:uncharacterized protein LOC133715843 [Rosa rugosa]|uniref:uncharacterized protein LOC133715843 n=1 Tax=Rosa rugosa TaxID=74645 RepID=UPI002B40F769|nr:uncharacterized protein LOC133715843 [Rosa rugosa]
MHSWSISHAPKGFILSLGSLWVPLDKVKKKKEGSKLFLTTTGSSQCLLRMTFQNLMNQEKYLSVWLMNIRPVSPQITSNGEWRIQTTFLQEKAVQQEQWTQNWQYEQFRLFEDTSLITTLGLHRKICSTLQRR